jgi:hypothetical protein
MVGMFQRNMLPPPAREEEFFYSVKLEASRFSEIIVTIY